MPLPAAILGASFFGGLLSTLVNFFVNVIGKRLALIIAAVAAITASYVIFAAAIQSGINAIDTLVAETWISAGLDMLPTNTDDCISTIITAHVAAFIYNWHKKIIGIKVNA